MSRCVAMCEPLDLIIAPTIYNLSSFQKLRTLNFLTPNTFSDVSPDPYLNLVPDPGQLALAGPTPKLNKSPVGPHKPFRRVLVLHSVEKVEAQRLLLKCSS